MSEQTKLSDEEIKALTDYFSVLIEIEQDLSLDKVLRDSLQRNKVFFRKLGIE